MGLSTVQGVIRRRLLVNFRIDPDVAQRQLPQRFSPKLHDGHAVGGICLIRLEQLRPRHFPAFAGLSSDNAAHRFAVTWNDDAGERREGVYIPRRDTGSLLNRIAGGRLFPGTHRPATFDVTDDGERVAVAVRSADGTVDVRVEGKTAAHLDPGSIFGDLEEASSFFEAGSLGFSATPRDGELDGVRLVTDQWQVRPLHVESVATSFFDDRSRFPDGSVEFDCALIMRDIKHHWRAVPV